MPAPDADLAAVRSRLRDVGVASSYFGDTVDDDIDLAIQRAVAEYSSARPDDVVADIEGGGTPYYDLSDLTGFVWGWSQVTAIEYPVRAISASYRPVLLDPSSDWTWHRDADARYLRLIRHTPSVGETLRVTYTLPHTLTDASDTIIAGDKPAVLDLAASYACLMLATEASANVDPANNVDSVNHRDAQLRFRQQAEDWRKAYERHMGIGQDKPVAPAGLFRDFDPVPVGRPWLTHGSRR